MNGCVAGVLNVMERRKIFSIVMQMFLLASLTVLISRMDCAQDVHFPRFEEYPARGNFKGKPAPVNIRSHPKASLFRTMLREGAKSSPNFAVYYTVIMWGCGSDCMQVAVVDARNGRVYFAPFTTSVSMKADFRLNSRLLIRNPPERNESPYGSPMLEDYKPSWHVWRHDLFVEVYPKKSGVKHSLERQHHKFL